MVTPAINLPSKWKMRFWGKMAAFFVILQNFGQTCVQDEDREVPGEDYTWSGLGSDYEEDQSGARVAKYTAPVAELGSAQIAM